jgi:ribosomal protein S18 acetylase RimI-like enzyme
MAVMKGQRGQSGRMNIPPGRGTMKTSEEKVRIVTLRRPTRDQVRRIEILYRQQGWWKAGGGDSPQIVPKLISGSHCFVAAVEGMDIVGMGRAISDGISDAYIQDLTVRSDRRNQGIGRRILNALIERLHADGLYWTGLIAEPGSTRLYRSAGFQKMTGCVPMMMNPKK